MSRMPTRGTPLLAAVLLLGCPSDDDDSAGIPGDDDTVGDDDTSEPLWEGCRATPQAADRDRLAVVSFPYGEGAEQATTWAAMTLTAEGEVVDDGIRFDMGRATGGEVVFTPDGEVGLAVQEDGSVGVFRVAGGEVQVVHASLTGAFYASKVVMEPSGERAWVVDGNWAENGGGLYELTIDCEDGSVTEGTRVLESKLAADLLLHPRRTDRAVLAADEVPGTDAGADAALLDYGATPTVLGGADAFGDDEQWIAGAAFTLDGEHVLLGDNNAFSPLPNRIAVLGVWDDAIEPVQVLSDIEDPIAIVPSPFDDAALVLSGYGDALFSLTYDSIAAEPFGFEGDLNYDGARPALPTAASMVTRGPLTGRVLVTENQGVRAVQFEGDGSVTDLGMQIEGDGYTWIAGAIGIQP